MQGLRKLARFGSGKKSSFQNQQEQRVRRNPQSGATDVYQPLDAGIGSLPSTDASGRARGSRRRCCFNTQGRAFNLLVSIVICANAILLGLEADLGLLSISTPRWDGLETDMESISLDPSYQDNFKDDLRMGIEADINLKRPVGENLQDIIKNDANLKEGLSLQNGSPHLKSGAYTIFEFIFVAFYAIEMCCRLCDVGRRKFFASWWGYFDVVVVGFGFLDLILPLVMVPKVSSSSYTVMSAIRMTRVLRLVRIFRVCHEVGVIGQAVSKAFSIVAIVGVLIFIFNFVVAIALTSLLGQRAYQWHEKADDIKVMFGSMGRSMRTLFAIMTLSGWTDIAMVLSEVIPEIIVVIFIVLYILICSFTMLSLVTGMISDSFLIANREYDKHKAMEFEKRGTNFANALTNVLSSCDQNQTGFLSRDEFNTALVNHPAVPSKLKALNICADIDDLLQLFDRLVQDSGNYEAVRMDSLVEAIMHLTGAAKASRIFDLKYVLLTMRQEMGAQATQMSREMDEQRQQVMNLINTTAKRVEEVQQEVLKVKQAAAMAQHEVSAIIGKLENFKRQQELRKHDEHAALATLNQKIDLLAAQLAAQITIKDKLDNLATQFAAQFAVKFAAHFAPHSGTMPIETGNVPFPKLEGTNLIAHTNLQSAGPSSFACEAMLLAGPKHANFVEGEPEIHPHVEPPIVVPFK